jgi:hypothetical protein
MEVFSGSMKPTVPPSEFPVSASKYVKKMTVSPFTDENSENLIDDGQ